MMPFLIVKPSIKNHQLGTAVRAKKQISSMSLAVLRK
jgi:hypothetical protein